MIGLRDDNDALPPAPPPSRAPELAAHIFADGGSLHAGLTLEHRPEQEQMARAVAGALRDDAALLFEAGTGVGKSLAYLVPGLIHAIDQTRQLVVSTHTISLQEQIEAKDLPLCRRLFKSDPALARYADFKSAVLVGKSNYLCTTRLAAALAGKQELFPTAEHNELLRIADWAATSRAGLRHELSPPPSAEVWEHVNADSSACSRKNCDCERCFYQRARARLRQAQVVIVNHSLLFALINAGGATEKGAARGVIFPDDFVVLDEAHTVPEVATDHFGLRLSSYGVDRLLKYLYNPRTKRGLLTRHGGALECQLVVDSLEAAEQFFGFIADRLLIKQPIVRVREPDVVEPLLEPPLLALIKAVSTLADKLEEGKVRDELLDQKGRLKSCQSSLKQWLALADEKQVYWAERGGRRQTIVTLRTAPIDVAPYLHEELFSRGTAVVCTSATLAIGGEISAFQQRVGAPDAQAVVVRSPFDYERNMRVFVAADVPLPSAKDARLALDALIDYLRFCILRSRGGSLVLFTSYADLRACASALAADFAAAGRPLLVQGGEFSRTELARKLQAAGNGVLFGTDSFWTGVDVPGDSLSQVIITRLPFDPPTHPILEARAEWIRDRGGNPFNELTLPEALIKFRQGIGRLIRSAHDRGVITLLDARVLAKQYGRLFLATLPTSHHVRITRENREEAFQPFA
ncbi:ATP-dependent DNA helicase [Horticoccus luteus]|uniref:ATP-dependent DNA helicase n=1 Tax=Horticoccus luteus TaxID=2862869 RepID=A0A8F9TTA2_9BACT|nr:helicase C-terminal domain-containing protein [Horticoccus luteus]QYM77646.1 ATP-dependent DNA helicase [Horticoccus luteus]